MTIRINSCKWEVSLSEIWAPGCALLFLKFSFLGGCKVDMNMSDTDLSWPYKREKHLEVEEQQERMSSSLLPSLHCHFSPGSCNLDIKVLIYFFCPQWFLLSNGILENITTDEQLVEERRSGKVHQKEESREKTYFLAFFMFYSPLYFILIILPQDLIIYTLIRSKMALYVFEENTHSFYQNAIVGNIKFTYYLKNDSFNSWNICSKISHFSFIIPFFIQF